MRLFADPVGAGFAMQAEIEMIMLGMRFVRAGPQDRGEIATGGDAQGHQPAALDVLGQGDIGDGQILLARQVEGGDVDGVAERMLAELRRRVAIAVAALIAGAGRDRRQRLARMRLDDGGRDIGDPCGAWRRCS